MPVKRYLPVRSTIISYVGYDPMGEILAVIFTTSIDKVYLYANVSALMYAKLLNAESVGVWFSEHIKAKPKTYPYASQTIPNLDALLGQSIRWMPPTDPLADDRAKLDELRKSVVRHNHPTRVIMPEGQCPGCDVHHQISALEGRITHKETRR